MAPSGECLRGLSRAYLIGLLATKRRCILAAITPVLNIVVAVLRDRLLPLLVERFVLTLINEDYYYRWQLQKSARTPLSERTKRAGREETSAMFCVRVRFDANIFLTENGAVYFDFLSECLKLILFSSALGPWPWFIENTYICTYIDSSLLYRPPLTW